MAKYTWTLTVDFTGIGYMKFSGKHMELVKIENAIRATVDSLEYLSFHYIGKEV